MISLDHHSMCHENISRFQRDATDVARTIDIVARFSRELKQFTVSSLTSIPVAAATIVAFIARLSRELEWLMFSFLVKIPFAVMRFPFS